MPFERLGCGAWQDGRRKTSSSPDYASSRRMRLFALVRRSSVNSIL